MNYTDALEIFKKLLTEPTPGINSLRQQSLPWMEFALVNSEMGNNDEALKAYKRGYTLMKEEMKGNIGKKFILTEEFASPKVPPIQDLLANIHIAIGLNNYMDADLREAMKDVEEFEKASRFNSKSLVPQFYQGYALERRGKGKEAKIIFDSLVKRGTGLVRNLSQQALSRL
ncbi:hypothetical protein [Armatimonas rosea]|uniref:Tetratricopeptide (TPR) repeat protein n=1 Tax=Armatimonas rosea TaxID=685828 RepID=A0A7W9SQ49_ARMRO|nr:hypothetical protein [Armatimonas rosea]MBB6049963.1 tetratricopeptide (TPR) repeat protein [Armatimonas rosea]